MKSDIISKEDTRLMNPFIERLSKHIKEKNISIPSIVKGTGIGSPTIHSYLNGTVPTVFKAKKIADFLDVSLEYLLGGEETVRIVHPTAQSICRKINSLDEVDLKTLNNVLEPFLNDRIGKKAIRIAEDMAKL